jgi:tRNA (mo5U34)-methyltransferase
MIDYQPFLNALANDPGIADHADSWVRQLPEQIARGLDEKRFGDLPRWKKTLQQFPDIPLASYDLDGDAITLTATTALSEQQHSELKQLLQGLHPWHKGPFNMFGVTIDTEWHSDWKWNRLKQHIEPLAGRKVLDIGCGSGYHCWRIRGAGAEWVIGIDPSPLFVLQFFALQKYIQDPHVSVLPMGIEHLPEKLHFFDTVFSMGVLYHRRSPFDHLIELRDSLRKGGELVLETLIIDGAEGETLVPSGRYARMGNVWFLPSCATLELWLGKVGFSDIKLIDVTTTSTKEQRSTEWMTFHSLQQFLDPEDSSKTIEGYPAPRRAIFTARAA